MLVHDVVQAVIVYSMWLVLAADVAAVVLCLATDIGSWWWVVGATSAAAVLFLTSVASGLRAMGRGRF